MKNRLYGLDVLRIFSALFVCAFHTNIHLGAQYGILTNFVKMGAVFMTLFFILSGYSLYISTSGESLFSTERLKIFFKKRFIGIVPMYYIVGLTYVLIELVRSRGGHYYKRLFCFR